MSYEYVTPQKGEDLTFPRFYIRPVQNNVRSEAEGRPIYEDREYVEITVAGDTRTTVDRQVKDEDRHRWAASYAAFKAGAEQAEDGTPLEAWPFLTPAMIMEYKAMKIRTVEHLAALSDVALTNLGTGGRTIRERAKAWLQQAAGDAPLSRVQSELEALKEQLAVRDATIADLAAEIERLKSKIVETA